jgi:signal transduction histidine kinase
LAPGTETKLGQFAELVAIAIANAQARTEVERLADEQAALRRVATLVAQGIGAEPIFQAVADEARALLACDNAAVVRFEADGTVTTMGARNASRRPGTRIVPDPRYVVAAVRATGRAARFDTDDPLAPGLPDAVRAEGIRTALASPIVVDGELWGTMTVGRTGDEVLPPEAEARLEKLAELIATAVGNAESREALSRLAEDQAALQRVATLVARGVEPAELFAAVSREVGRMFGSDMATVGRWDPDGPAHIIVGLVKPMAGLDVGSRLPLTATTAAAAVYRTGRSARTDAPFSAVAREMKAVSGVSSPVVVEGRPWGVISVASREPLPHDAEQRLEKFTELVATAVANAESRMALSRLADEQAALRRVATLVAHGASPAAVFDSVAAEMHALLQADGGLTMCRYEQDGELTIVAHRGAQEPQLQPGTRIRHDDPHSVTASVRRTGQPARQDTYADTHGSIGHVIERLRFRSGVGVPILVDGRVWGVTVANWMGEQPPPPDTERRMAQFGELLDTAIANADGRDQLNASRARLLTTADDVRRRVVRDLHDGAQQRLVHGIVSLKLARRALPDDDGELRSLVEEALEHVELGNAELRELARGILPANLTHSGLRAAIRTVVSRLDLPVRVDVPDQRFPAEVEASAYFTVAEALTNVLKHAEATSAEVTASATDVALRIEVRDDGIGGADPDGAGLLGLRDRAAALGGWVTIESPADGGTVLAATLPLTRG